MGMLSFHQALDWFYELRFLRLMKRDLFIKYLSLLVCGDVRDNSIQIGRDRDNQADREPVSQPDGRTDRQTQSASQHT